MSNIFKFFGNALTAWALQPIYQIAIAVLVIALMAVYFKKQQA